MSLFHRGVAAINKYLSGCEDRPLPSSFPAFCSPELHLKGNHRPVEKFKGGKLDPVTGQYENRIKYFANPEKVFEYFSSKWSDGGWQMTFTDFMNSVLPYTFQPVYSDLKMPGEDSGSNLDIPYLSLVDLDSDGLLSFQEFLFLTTIISTSLREARTAFHLFAFAPHKEQQLGADNLKRNFADSLLHIGEDDDAQIDYGEFVEMMTALIRRSPRGRKVTVVGPVEHDHRVSSFFISLDHRAVSCTKSLEEVVGTSGLTTSLFGEDREELLTWRQWRDIVEGIQRDVAYYEFCRHGGTPSERGKQRDSTINILDLSGLLIGFLHPRKMEAMSAQSWMRCSGDWLGKNYMKTVRFAEYYLFERVLSEMAAELHAAVNLTSKEGITRDTLKRILLAVHNNRDPSQSHPIDLESLENLVDVVFTVFDVDESGSLSTSEFFGNLSNRQARFVDIDPLVSKELKESVRCTFRILKSMVS